MEAGHLNRHVHVRRILVWTVAATLLVTGTGVTAARATDPRLQDARRATEERQARLDTLYQQLAVLESEQERLTALLVELEARLESERAAAEAAAEALGVRVRESYMNGSTDPTLALLASGSSQEVAEQARVLGLLARRGVGDVEGAESARTRTEAAARAVAEAQDALARTRAEFETAQAEAERLVAEARAQEQRVGDEIAAEERERLLREGRSGDFVGTGGPAATVVGDVACPVGEPHRYSDSWGAPRSGGRSHKGVDILADIGIPIYAYESGVITRKNNNGLGGTSLYLRGDSGNEYYYTHLSGYVSGVDEGDRVTVGQHIAFNGDTGNARGIPHLHWEVHPNGGSPVNPYPYAFRACG
jgi:murein DD-endopeptidase MepM/ murein hydrolase activator NlpD